MYPWLLRMKTEFDGMRTAKVSGKTTPQMNLWIVVVLNRAARIQNASLTFIVLSDAHSQEIETEWNRNGLNWWKRKPDRLCLVGYSEMNAQIYELKPTGMSQLQLKMYSHQSDKMSLHKITFSPPSSFESKCMSHCSALTDSERFKLQTLILMYA